MIKPENLGRVLTAALFVVLAFALVLILMGYSKVGIVICILTLILNRARGIFKVRIWLLRTLCGIKITPQEAEMYRAQLKAQKGKSAVRTPFGDTRKAATPPKPDVLSEAEIARRIADNRRSGILLKRVWPIGTPDIPKSWPQNSWIGGLPHLAAGLDWPRHGTTNLPLHFLSQIDLSEMPHPQSEPKLPDTGSLYFFANISEDLDWEEGSDSSDSAVLYTPDSTRDLPQTPEPDNMPVMHHQGDLLPDHGYSHLGVHQTHAPKWPVTPQVIDTWDIEAMQTRGQYDEGLNTAIRSAIDAAFSGVFQDRKWTKLPELISRKMGLIDTPDDMITDGPSGVPTQFYQKPIPEGKTFGVTEARYAPTAMGGTLPFCGTGARVLLPTCGLQSRRKPIRPATASATLKNVAKTRPR